MKIAILHEMLIKFGGAEKVVEHLMRIFPDADLYTLMYDEEKIGPSFPAEKIHPSCKKLLSQKIYNLTKKQRFCLPVMKNSVEELDFSEYDVVIASSSGFAHGAITKPDTKFIVYYHSPARYMWDWTNEYKADIGWSKGLKGLILNSLFLKLRQWDYIASNRVDISLANSSNTQGRITKYYRKESEVVYPPIETSRFAKKLKLENIPQKYYIIISALTEFKKIDVAISAFNKMPDMELKIIGKGDYDEQLKLQVSGSNISFLGAQYGDDLVALVQNSQGLIFPGEEDFGMVPIEVMAAGKPVFAYNGGGLTETVIPGITGEFFDEVSGSDFIEKFTSFDSKNTDTFYKAENCIKQAEKFSEAVFERRMRELVK